jgi:hypothetical protein
LLLTLLFIAYLVSPAVLVSRIKPLRDLRTTHPAAVLRLSGAEQTSGSAELVADLRLAARFVA